MRFPEPHPGLVIRYAYLWKREQDEGFEDGLKARPCAVVLSLREADGRIRVRVLPVTHSPPDDRVPAVEIPPPTKTRLGLDADRSWIVLSESNVFTWPGPDLRALPEQDSSAVAYGMLPKEFFRHIQTKFLELAEAGESSMVHRTE